MKRAVNPQTGEVLFLVNNQWVPPSRVAKNPDTGQLAYLVNNQWQVDPETSVTRRIFGDVPVGIAQGATTGVRMISDAFGAGNPISESLKGVEDYLGGLLSAQATNNLDATAKIIKEAENKGVLGQVKSGFQALAEAPLEIVSQFLGTAAPTILAGVGGALAKVGATGIGAIQAGTGATMGAGLIKGNIYEVVKDELTKAGVDPKIAEERATFAQNYTGENWDQILLGTGLGGAAALGPLERIFARAPAIPTGIAAKNMVTRGVAAGVMEGAPEFTQAFQEQVASNIALQREGFDVPTYRGAVANATLEGLAGFGIGAPIGMMSRGQKVGEPAPPPPEAQPPGAQPPAVPPPGAQPPGAQPPGAPPVEPDQPPGLMPGMVEAEPELTPEEEEELQAQIAGATAAPRVAPPAVSPDVAAQVEQLNARLAQVEAKRQDPTLSIDDYEAIENLDREEREIVQQIQALTKPPEELVAKQQISQPKTVAKQQISPSQVSPIDLSPIQQATDRKSYLDGVLAVSQELPDGTVITDPETDASWTIKKKTNFRGTEIIEFDAGGDGSGNFMFQKKPNEDWKPLGDIYFPTNPIIQKPTKVSSPQIPKVGFKTEKGSVYSLDEQGRTSRTKVSEGEGKGTTYEPHSTLYVDPKDAQSIMEDMQGGAIDKSTSIRLGYLNSENKFETITDISQIPTGAEAEVRVVDKKNNRLVGSYKAQLKPAVGLSPVEKRYTPDGMSNTHIGNKIVELFGKAEPTIEDQLRAQKSEERRERQAAQEAKKGEFVLQNRDRSTDASLAQMELIAQAPDYGQAGFSRTPDGAPIVSYGEVSPEQRGREDTVTTASGRKVPIQYAVVEANSVISSNDLQGRSNLDYGNKEVPGIRAIAGNGRITGLREAYKRGTAGRYIQDMANDSPIHGVSPDVISGMDQPVLVRVMSEQNLTKDIGDELNKPMMMELSPVEKARNDLNRVNLDGLEFQEDGEITDKSLLQFVRSQPIQEQPTLLDKGMPTRQARQRLENAIFARAYNDTSLITMFAQTADPEAKLVINALAQVAPQMAKLEGAGDLDIRDIVTDAAKIIISGKRRGLKLTEIASQVDMTVDPDTRIIVDLFAQNTRSNKAAIEALTNAAEIAYRESIRPEEGLFGAEPKMERRELVERMRRGYEPGRTQDVAQAQRPGAAPSDVERKVEPSAAAVPPADQEFALTGQTKEELAALERKEKTGEAKREKEEREIKELADRERDIFALQPTKAAPAPAAPPMRPTGDMFGATGMVGQPPRTAAAAPATPIEEAAKPKYEIKRKESYRGRTTPEVEYQILQDGKVIREYKRKKDAEQYLDMLTLSKEEVEKKYPELKAPKTKETLFAEEEAGSAIKKLEEGVTRFASGMSSLSDLDVAMRTRAGYRKNGVGVDVGLLSKNALDILAQTVINLKTPVFIDSGAFSAFTKKLRGKDSPALDFDKILEKYDSILQKIAEANPSEEQDYPRPMLVMPDIVGDQAGSVSLIENYKDWIRGEALGNLSQPIIPIQKGELSLSEVYDQIKGILGTDKFIVGVPSQEEAVSRQELADFLGTSKPPKVHFLGAASARKLNPLLAIVAEKSSDTQVSADASKVRSAILSGVAQGKTREDAIIDALRQEEDPAELVEKYYAQAGEKKPAEAEESFKETVEIYVKDISTGEPNLSTATDYDEAANTITYVETWEGEFRTPTEELDELISGANKSDTAKGAKYSILVKDTPTESVVMTFQPRGRKPTDKYVDVFMSVQKTTKEKPERTYKEEIEFRTKEKKLDDPGISKKIQESRGVSKPVADAYVRALRKRVEEQAKWTYGLGSEQAYTEANDEVNKIENRIRGIEKRKETKQEKAAVLTPGDIIESIDLPNNMQVRILKATDGFSVQMYDKDSDNVVDKSVTIFKESVFEDNAFDSAKEYADNLVKEVRQEAKEAEPKTKKAEKVVSQNLYHGTGSEFKDFDFDFNGGMTFFADQKGLAAKYAYGGGGQRRALADSEKYVINAKTNVVYELSGDRWKPIGLVDPDSEIVTQDTIKPLDKEYDSLSMSEASSLIDEMTGQGLAIPKKTRIIEVDVKDLKMLDITTPEGRDVIASLSPVTNRGAGLVEAAQFDKRGKDKDSVQLNTNFWTTTKFANAHKDALRKDIVDPLKKLGYDGIYFNDDQNQSYALFDTPKVKKQLEVKPAPTKEPKEEVTTELNKKAIDKFLEGSVFKKTLYHGTPSAKLPGGKPFSTFESTLIWMSSRPQFSEEFGDFIMPVYANIKNPYDFQKTGGFYKNANGQFVEGSDGEKVEIGYLGDNPEIIEDIINRGYDGAVDGTDFIVAFDPDQVRSQFSFETSKTEPKKEPSAGPTFAGMQAELEKLKKEQAALGIPEAPLLVRDEKAAREEREAKEKKKESKRLKQATRSDIEFARFDDLDTNPIQATPEQLKMAKDLAAKVDGELVFFDKDLELGLVAVPADGFENYFPIHGGKISKVDVSDYTGLSTLDKSFLNRVARAIKVFRDTKPGLDEFFNVEIDMPGDRQGSLFGSTSEAKKVAEAMEPKGKKLPPGRSPELTAAARSVRAGTMTAEEYNKLVDVYKPIPMYAEPLRPATAEQVYDALDVKKREQINPDIPNGTKVGLRLDIPAFNRKGVFVVSIHQKRTASAPGKVIGYGSVAKAKNVTFGVGNQLKALDIAAGEAKDALQTIEGEYINITPEQAFAEAQRAIKDPSYVQVGIDPTRHAYFYDRNTTLPVVSAEEVIQIGNMILAKKPVFGTKADFLYNIESQGVAGGSLPRSKKEIKEFLDRLSAEEDAKREVERQERIAYYASIRQKEVALQRRVRNYGSTIEIQRELNNLNQLAKELKEDIDLDKRPVYRAEEFLNQARAALEGAKFPYKEAKISPDVFAVIQAVYMDDPKLLEGLRLSIKPEFSPDETLLRRAHGMPQAAGAFAPFQRLVKLYTGTRGVDEPITIRHELTHTLEQMMTPAQRQAVISSYFKALEKAVKKHKDARSQEFFEKVTEFLNNPTRKNQIALNSALPSYDFYQYVNPSEYWAVNAEKLMAQRLGPSWERFKKAVRKLFEKMKDIFGFDNRFAVHQVFDQVMSGSKERLTKKMLADYIKSSGDRFDFLENIEDDAELMRRSGRADTPMLDVAPMKRILIRGAANAKESFKEMVENPSEILRMTFNPINRGVIYLRNKYIWFGTGINEADRIRYNGQVKVSNLIATASLALDNMIRGGNIATQVLFQGGIEFNPKTLMFGAVKKAMSMANVYRAEAAIKKRLGEQLGTNIIQGYLEAKRSRSIKNEVISRQKTLDKLQELVDDKVAELKALDADPNASEKEIAKVNKELRTLFREFQDAKRDLETIKKIAEDKVSMSEDMIEEFISRENVHPELREIMDNFNAVNKNLLAFWRQVGLISENRYNTLANIKDYVPWYRIMNDEEDVHSPLQATTRSATNIGKEKLFGPGKPSVVNDFIVEENQKVFKIQPGRVNAVKLEGKKLKPEDYEVTPQGEVTLKVDYKPGDVLIVETQREIENMIDNMTRNVMRMTMNGLRQYAAQRIVSEYATRDADGKIMTFGKTDIAKGRFDFIRDGRRTVVEIQDPLLAEGVLGMETVGMKMLWEPLATAANFTRRTITLSPVFQAKQVFKDAPTAALVTGVKSPSRLIGGVYKGFIDAIRDSDPAAGILRSVGIGGFYSPARTPEADVKRQIGIINNNTYDYVMKALDHFGDSSDMAQRIAIYNRVMAETGDEALAMYQAANVINFLRHGSGPVAQALVRTVPFLNAYAQSVDVLYNALVGGGLRGKDRAAALRQLAVTGSLLAGTTLLYAMLVGDDDDYMKMDDQSKVRNYMIPGTDVVLPMNTSAAFFFKAIPELIYNAFMSRGTENAVDEKRLRRAMKEAAVDLLLGPTPVPSAAKPVIEISLNYDFFTSRPVVPAGLKDLDAYQQYDMRTSEAAKLLSALTGGKENRLLNPVEADHLIRGILGTAGGMVAWSSNLIGEASEIRPEMGLKEMPITGAFLRPEVPRGREDLFYALKESTDRKFKTFNRLADRDATEAEAYLNKHPNLIAFYDYTSEMDTQLKEVNAAIRFIAETTDRSYTPEIKRKEIQELLNLKQDILEGVEMFRREAYSD